MYTPELRKEIFVWLESRLSDKLLAHVKRVSKTAKKLAERHAPEDKDLVRIAGLIHDAAKPLSDGELLQLAEQHGLPITDFEREVPMVLHGAVGYALAAKEFDLDDERLYTACAAHTTGAPGMSTADKIVFLADVIEPARDYPKVKKLRQAAKYDLDRAMLRATSRTLRYLVKSQRLVDPRLLELHNELVQQGVRYGKKAK